MMVLMMIPDKSWINFQNSRFPYFRQDHNQGQGAARQYALDQARGDFLCFLDADDWIYPQKLQLQLEVMQKYQHLGVLSSNMAVVNNKNEIIGIHSSSPKSNTFQVFNPMTYPAPLIISFGKLDGLKWILREKQVLIQLYGGQRILIF